MNLTSKHRTYLKTCVPEEKLIKESDFDIRTRPAPPKYTENNEQRISESKLLPKDFVENCCGVKYSKVANRRKHVLPRFQADRS